MDKKRKAALKGAAQQLEATVHVGKDRRDCAVHAGQSRRVVALVRKPYRQQDLLACIEVALGRHDSRDPAAAIGNADDPSPESL